MKAARRKNTILRVTRNAIKNGEAEKQFTICNARVIWRTFVLTTVCDPPSGHTCRVYLRVQGIHHRLLSRTARRNCAGSIPVLKNPRGKSDTGIVKSTDTMDGLMREVHTVCMRMVNPTYPIYPIHQSDKSDTHDAHNAICMRNGRR